MELPELRDGAFLSPPAVFGRLVSWPFAPTSTSFGTPSFDKSMVASFGTLTSSFVNLA
jgi:hypothetical protein